MLGKKLTRFEKVPVFAKPLRLLREYLATIPGPLFINSDELEPEKKTKLKLAIQRVLVPASLNNNHEDAENRKNESILAGNPFALANEEFDWKNISFGHYIEINGANDGLSEGIQRDQDGIDQIGAKLSDLGCESLLAKLTNLQTILVTIAGATESLNEEPILDEDTILKHENGVTQNLVNALGLLQQLREEAEEKCLKLDEMGSNLRDINQQKIANKLLHQFTLRLSNELSYHLYVAIQREYANKLRDSNNGINVSAQVENTKRFAADKKNSVIKGLHDKLTDKFDKLTAQLTQKIQQNEERIFSECNSLEKEVLSLQKQLEAEIFQFGKQALPEQQLRHEELSLELEKHELKKVIIRNAEQAVKNEKEGNNSQRIFEEHQIKEELLAIENIIIKKGRESKEVLELQKQLRERMQTLTAAQLKKCQEPISAEIINLQLVFHRLHDIRLDLQQLFLPPHCVISRVWLEQQIQHMFNRLRLLSEQARKFSDKSTVSQNRLGSDSKQEDSDFPKSSYNFPAESVTNDMEGEADTTPLLSADNSESASIVEPHSSPLQAAKRSQVDDEIESLLSEFSNFFEEKTEFYFRTTKQRALVVNIFNIDVKIISGKETISDIIKKAPENSKKSGYQHTFLTHLSSFRSGNINECQFYTKLTFLHEEYRAKHWFSYCNPANWINGKLKQFSAMRNLQLFVNKFVADYQTYLKQVSVNEKSEVSYVKNALKPVLDTVAKRLPKINKTQAKIRCTFEGHLKEIAQLDSQKIKGLRIGTAEDCAMVAMKMELLKNRVSRHFEHHPQALALRQVK